MQNIQASEAHSKLYIAERILLPENTWSPGLNRRIVSAYNEQSSTHYHRLAKSPDSQHHAILHSTNRLRLHRNREMCAKSLELIARQLLSRVAHDAILHHDS